MRRTRIDLGQKPSGSKETNTLERKIARWDARNKHLPPSANPFLEAIRPKHENFGDPEEKEEDLRKRLQNLEFGNFPGYFNYRNKAAVEVKATKDEDPSRKAADSVSAVEEANGSKEPCPDLGLLDERLKFFEKEWIENKYVLDIGCNRGHITYSLAKAFKPKSIIGIDIDLKMVQMANRDLHLHLEGPDGIVNTSGEFRVKRAGRLRATGVETYTEDMNQFPVSSYVVGGPISISDEVELLSTGDAHMSNKESDNQVTSSITPESNTLFPNNLIFIEHNYVLAKDELVDKQKAFFDTIVCLSVTKWIHLNYCDAGLKRFFRRIYNHLKPGGLLILEAQPFDNYARRKKFSDRLKANFYCIQFKPEHFDTYLLSGEVGFKRIIYETIGQHECAGFKRPIKVFQK